MCKDAVDKGKDGDGKWKVRRNYGFFFWGYSPLIWAIGRQMTWK